MLILNETLSIVRAGSCGDLKLCRRSASVSHNKSGCGTVYNSVERYHVQKQHVHSHKVSFTRVSHYLCKSLNERTTRPWLHRFHANASTDDDFRSSRNIAISLFKRYKNVIDRGGGDNLKVLFLGNTYQSTIHEVSFVLAISVCHFYQEFISAGVQAYALGCTDEGLRKELMDIKDSGVEIEGLGSYGGTRLKFKIHSSEVRECILWLSIVFITLLCTPQPTVIRWSPNPPVSADVLHQWKGFCAFITNAYYVKGMAWLPVKTLQLEQMAVTGSSEEPSLVASRMQLVFSTLEVVSQQWPRL